MGVSLAGCASLAWSCQQPPGDLRETLPTTGAFEQVFVEPFADGGDVEEAYRSNYDGPDWNRYFLSAMEFRTEAAAKENIEKTPESEEGTA